MMKTYRVVIPLVVSLLLAASLFLPADFSRPRVALWAIVAVLAVEAFARGYFWAFVLRLLVVLVVLDLLLVYWQNWQVLSAGVLPALSRAALVVGTRALRRDRTSVSLEGPTPRDATTPRAEPELGRGASWC